MAITANDLLKKLQSLSDQRLLEVEDFIEFLSAREARLNARELLRANLKSLDAQSFAPVTDEEIQAEIQAARQALRNQHA
jgi:hypothetical protein